MKTAMLFPGTDKQSRRIGLLADSHGSLASILGGVACLKDSRADQFIHLGDIFDSLRNDPLDEIYEAVLRYELVTVKGNNDYQLETLLAAGNTFDLPPDRRQQILSFLRKMPLRVEDGNVCFAHSLPFDGIRSFYEPIDTGVTTQAVRLFNATTYHILFCGHSHTSVLFRWRLGKVTREPIHPQTPVRFLASERYILIVGAADKGECGIYDKARKTYNRISSQSFG